MKLVEIGKFGKTFGIDGQLRCQIEDAYLDDFLQSEALFVKINGHPVPYFPEAIEEDKELSVRIEEIASREEAQVLSGKIIFLRAEDLHSIVPDDLGSQLSQYQRWLGFTIIDENQGEISKIKDFVELPQQLLAVLDYQEKEVLIPFQTELILDLDESAQTILMDLPEGLLDL